MHGPTLAEHGRPRGLPGRLSVTRLSGAALRALSKVVICFWTILPPPISSTLVQSCLTSIGPYYYYYYP